MAKYDFFDPGPDIDPFADEKQIEAEEEPALSSTDLIKEERRKASHLKAEAGKYRAIERSNQRLPIRINSITASDLIRLKRLIISDVVEARASPHLTRGALAILASLTTGRRLSELAELHVYHLPLSEHLRTFPRFGLVYTERLWGWWLKSGRPASEQSLHRDPFQTTSPSPGVWLPCSRLFLTLLHRSFLHRQLDLSEGDSAPIFGGQTTSLDDDADFFLQILRQHPEYSCDIRITKAERWLSETIASGTTGDHAVATLITGREDTLSKSTCHYTSLSQKDVQRYYLEAISRFDGHSQEAWLVPVSVQAARIGSRYHPRAVAMKKVGADLRHYLRGRRGKSKTDLASLHNAMLLYTFALVGLGTGFRAVRNPLPRLDAICEDSGFAILDDKRTSDNYKARIIWIARPALQQIRLYEEHVEALLRQLTDVQKQKVARISGVKEGQVPIFMLDRQSRPRAVSPATIRAMLAEHKWHLKLNAGRHYLRTELLGKCRSDTLTAFMGHWNRGTEPWAGRSGLDPLAYRDDIAPPLEELLARDEWVSAPGLRLPN